MLQLRGILGSTIACVLAAWLILGGLLSDQPNFGLQETLVLGVAFGIFTGFAIAITNALLRKECEIVVGAITVPILFTLLTSAGSGDGAGAVSSLFAIATMVVIGALAGAGYHFLAHLGTNKKKG
jgi:hypothetical protein